MPSDSKFTRDENGDIAVRVVTETEQLPASDPNWMFARDTNGNIAVRVVGAGSGGGDPHNKGWFATQAALEAAYATAEAGDYAIVGSTDTVWVWDTDDSEWVDTGAGGAVTSVNGQTGDVTLGINDVAPSQTGFSGRVLGTDGFVAGWVEPEKIQRSTMPVATSENQGDIVQYVGATTADYTNGYIYKSIQETANTATAAFDPQESNFGFNHDYAVKLAEFIAGFGIPDYTNIIDQIAINSDGADVWFVQINQSAQYATWGSLIMSTEELESIGFIVPSEPEALYNEGSITWSTTNVRKWKHCDTGSYIPTYTELPAPSVDNIDSVALYMGETVEKEEGEWLVKGRIYTVKELAEFQFETTTEGDFGYDIIDEIKFQEQVGEESGSITFVASVSGDVVTWSVDGEPVDISDYGIVILDAPEDGNSLTVTWGDFLIGYRWVSLSTAYQPAEPIVLTSDSWSEYGYNWTWVPGVTADNTVIVGPTAKSYEDYMAAGIVCVMQSFDSLKFTCKTVPQNDIEVSVTIL